MTKQFICITSKNMFLVKKIYRVIMQFFDQLKYVPVATVFSTVWAYTDLDMLSQ